MNARDCRPGGYGHRWDTTSGWCLNGCGNRRDGRVVNRQGRIILPGPPYASTDVRTISDREDHQ